MFTTILELGSPKNHCRDGLLVPFCHNASAMDPLGILVS